MYKVEVRLQCDKDTVSTNGSHYRCNASTDYEPETRLPTGRGMMVIAARIYAAANGWRTEQLSDEQIIDICPNHAAKPEAVS